MSLLSNWDIRNESYSDAASVTLLTDTAGSMDYTTMGVALPTYSSARTAMVFTGSQAIGEYGSLAAGVATALSTSNWTFSMLLNQPTAIVAGWIGGFANSTDGNLAAAFNLQSDGTVRAFIRQSNNTQQTAVTATAMVPDTPTVVHMWKVGTTVGIALDTAAETESSSAGIDLSGETFTTGGLGVYPRNSFGGGYYTGDILAARFYDSDESANRTAITADMKAGPVTVTTASRNVTNVAAGAVQTFQVMEAGVNKTAGEGLGGSDLVLIEDNHQVTVPLVVDGVTLTIGADTLDYQLDQTEMAAAGNSITFDAVYYSPTEQQSSKIAVTITAPSADTPPTSPANQAVNVTEGNTAVGNTSTATGTAPMTYSKGGTDAASFNVNSTTGALTFITAPDYEVKTSYSVTVVANNTFGTDSHIVTVTILNALEETITAPTPANVGYGYGEAGVPHTDSGLLAWLATASVTGGGAVTNNLAAQVDPLVNATVITFSASDAANQTATVTPTEAAPTAPVMPATATRNVAQPNQLMGVYVTSNTPIPAVTYTLTGTDAGLLSINGSTGSVTANSPTSVAGKSSYSFNVVATNVGGTDATAVTVTIVAVVARNMTEWIEANGAGGQTNEAWLKYMLGAGASGKTFNDLMFDWLGVLGYTGSLSDRIAAWSKVSLN